MKNTRDELADVLATSINKQFKNMKAVYFLGGKDKTPTDITDFISTGSSLLDLAISNKERGGAPVGRIVELQGMESSGKSLIGAHILAETQKRDGIGVYIDTETAVSTEFLKAIGVDIDSMLYAHLETAEEIFETIESIIVKVREADKNRLVTILVDSLSGASTKIEMESDYDKDGWATAKAIIISKALRKITQMIGKQRILLVFTNQLRQKLGVMFGDPWTTSGGKALGFHSSVRVRLSSIKKIIDKDKNVIGIRTKAIITKNRVGPPFRQAEFNIYFDSGIRDRDSWLDFLKQHKLISAAGAWYTINYKNKDLKFLSKDFEKLLDQTDGLADHLYSEICKYAILKYKTEDLGIDDIFVDDEIIE